MTFLTVHSTRRILLPALSAIAVVAVACGTGTEPASGPEPTATSAPISTVQPTADTDTAVGPKFEKPTEPVEINFEGPEAAVARRFQLSFGWFTDFNQRTVDLGEISSLLGQRVFLYIEVGQLGELANLRWQLGQPLVR